AVPPPAPPARLNYHLPHVPGFGNIGGGTNPQMDPERVKLLARKLAGVADHGFGGPGGFARRLEEALTPPPAPPGLAPGTPPPINPLPPDAADATGHPHAYRQITQGLRDAAADLTRRADAMAELAEPMGSATVDAGLFSRFTAMAARAAEAGAAPGAALTSPGGSGPPAMSPDEAAAAIDALAAEYPPVGEVLDDPRLLTRLAADIAPHRHDPHFAAGFVERFGAENLVAVPRTLQAWQYGRVAGRPLFDHERGLPSEHLERRPTDQEHRGILYAFSATLATATNSDSLDDDVRDDVTATDDPLALSWLLTNHDIGFDTEFLLKAFEHVKVIVQAEARRAATIGPDPLPGTGPITSPDGEALSTDPKVAILNAISRNPQAAHHLINTAAEPITVETLQGPVEVDSTLDLLYRHGTYGDGGAAVGRMVAAANGELHRLTEAAGRDTDAGQDIATTANELTLRMAHEAAYGRDALERAVVGLAPILAQRHMADIQASVGTRGCGVRHRGAGRRRGSGPGECGRPPDRGAGHRRPDRPVFRAGRGRGHGPV
ncbi:MAG: hypothetical protein ACRDY7_15930, partial [Acidimicrobiia bacterium]